MITRALPGERGHAVLRGHDPLARAILRGPGRRVQPAETGRFTGLGIDWEVERFGE